eukprot:5524006-Prymnesium_polylepis.1
MARAEGWASIRPRRSARQRFHEKASPTDMAPHLPPTGATAPHRQSTTKPLKAVSIPRGIGGVVVGAS